MANTKAKPGKKKACRWNSIVEVNGVKMTVEERNRLMKLEYLNGGVSLQDLAGMYGISYQTIRGLSSKEKWKEQKEQFARNITKMTEEQLTSIYVAAGVDVNILYNNAWQALMNEAVQMLKTKEGLTKNGVLDVYKLNQLADVLTKAQTGQNLCNGFISATDKAKIDIQREQMDLKKMILGMSDDTVIEDNFLECLNQAAERCGITEKLDLLDVEDDD